MLRVAPSPPSLRAQAGARAGYPRGERTPLLITLGDSIPLSLNALLVIGFVAFILFLLVVEAYTAVKGLPTISERLQRVGKTAPLVTVVVCTLTGMLVIHFFGISQVGC